METVLIEIEVPIEAEGAALLDQVEARLQPARIDRQYAPVPMVVGPDQVDAVGPDKKIVIVRGSLSPQARQAIENRAGVVRVWSDAPVAPFKLDR